MVADNFQFYNLDSGCSGLTLGTTGMSAYYLFPWSTARRLFKSSYLLKARLRSIEQDSRHESILDNNLNVPYVPEIPSDRFLNRCLQKNEGLMYVILWHPFFSFFFFCFYTCGIFLGNWKDTIFLSLWSNGHIMECLLMALQNMKYAPLILHESRRKSSRKRWCSGDVPNWSKDVGLQ